METSPHYIERIVRFADTDPAGIMYFPNYAIFFDEGIIDAIRKSGIKWEDREKHNFFMPVVEQKVNYLKPASAGDQLRIYTVVDMIKDKVFRSQHLMTRCIDGSEIALATGYIVRVTVDIVTIKSKLMPELFRESLTGLLSPPEKWEDFLKSFNNK